MASSATNYCFSTFDLAGSLLVSFRFASIVGFPSSVFKPVYKSCCLYAKHQQGQYISQGTPLLVPKQTEVSGFLMLSYYFGTSSTVHLHSALIHTSDSVSQNLFPIPFNTLFLRIKHRRVIWQVFLIRPAGGSTLCLLLY